MGELAHAPAGRAVILTGGRFRTGLPGVPAAEAIWIEGGTIRAVGSTAEIRSRAGTSGGKPVSLAGSCVTPGWTDAHAHVLTLGLTAEQVDLTGAESVAAVQERIRSHLAERAPSTSWILGRGWDQTRWPGGAYPEHRDLDVVTGDRPAVFTRIDGHAAWANLAAMRAGGLDDAAPDPPGGSVLRDAAGRLTGILIDAAMDAVGRVTPAFEETRRRDAVARVARRLLRHGVTAVHDMGLTSGDAALFERLDASGELGVRVYGALLGTDPGLDRVLAAPPRRTEGRFELGMVKFFVDGALGSRGAALFEPYCDDPANRGLDVTPLPELRAGLARVVDAGYQAAVHAIGDRANRGVLDCWEALTAARPGYGAGRPAPPLRVEHAQILHPDDLDRFSEMGVVASMQPAHCISDMPWAEERLGAERLAYAYAWRSLRDRGVVLAAGSDFPIETPDPRYGFFAAVARRSPHDPDAQPWNPGERLTRAEALAAFTAAPARVAGHGDRRGILAPGYAADLAIWDRDLFEVPERALLDAEVWTTMVDGKVGWRHPGAPFPPLHEVHE